MLDLKSSSICNQISHDEGRAIPDTNGYRYEYFYTDHLGNVRLAFRDSIGVPNLPVITQINAYDGWGQMLQGIDYERNTNNKSNNFKYNGKENQDDFGIGYTDYGARMYDKILGRWFAQDPLSELDFDQGSYNYVDNNPVRRIDLFGCTDCDNDGKDDGDCKNGGDLPEATIKGERLPQFRGFFENQQIAYARNERLYGHASPFRKDFQDGGRDAIIGLGASIGSIFVLGYVTLGVTAEGAVLGASRLQSLRRLGMARRLVWSGVNSKLAASKLALSLTSQYVGAKVDGLDFGFGDIDFVDVIADQVLQPLAGALGSATFDISLNKQKANSGTDIAVGTATGFLSNRTEGFLDKSVKSLNLSTISTNATNYVLQLYQKISTTVLTPNISNEIKK